MMPRNEQAMTARRPSRKDPCRMDTDTAGEAGTYRHIVYSEAYVLRTESVVL